MKNKDILKQKLLIEYPDAEISIEDFSTSHQKHKHNNLNYLDETHLKVYIKSKTLSSMKRVERHRAVNAIVKPLINNKIHAITFEFL